MFTIILIRMRYEHNVLRTFVSTCGGIAGAARIGVATCPERNGITGRTKFTAQTSGR
jgi:hypothetical protein